MSGYLSAVRALQAENGFSVADRRPYRVRRLLRALDSIKGRGHRIRLPVTVPILRLIKDSFDWEEPDFVTMFTIMVLATFGLFRLGECTAKSQRSMTDSSLLRRQNFQFYPSFEQPEFMVVHLSVTKTDRFKKGRRGANIIIGVSGGDI